MLFGWVIQLLHHRRHVYHNIAQGECAAGVDVAVDKVGLTASVGGLGGIYLSAYKAGVTPAAFAAAAVGRRTDAGLFQSIQQGLICTAGNGLRLTTNQHGNLKGLAGSFLGIGCIAGGIAVFTVILRDSEY